MSAEFTEQVRSVSQITTEIKAILENKFRFILVCGEISNLKTPFSGHHYFTLKDKDAQLRAVMFKGQQRYLDEPLKDGQQVICRGRISVYEPRGEYQLIIDSVVQSGAGLLQQRFEELKKRLAEEGLFNAEQKKKIPAFPEKIVVVSSATGAALQDFLKICRQRKTMSRIQIFPVPVQGNTAAGKIAHSLKVINESLECDVIVLCRGGGSIEDLWAFNEEVVARAINKSHIPVVTGIGHEIDTTIADLCADLRGPTPTGAAERIIPDSNRLELELNQLKMRMQRTFMHQLSMHEEVVSQQHRFLSKYRNTVENLTLRLDLSIERFQQATIRLFGKRQEQINALVARIQHQAPLNVISLQEQKLTHLRERLHSAIEASLERSDDRLARTAAVLQSVSPLSVLSRGYSIVQKKDPRSGALATVTDSRQVARGDELNILLSKGKIRCEVIDSRTGEGGLSKSEGY